MTAEVDVPELKAWLEQHPHCKLQAVASADKKFRIIFYNTNEIGEPQSPIDPLYYLVDDPFHTNE